MPRASFTSRLFYTFYYAAAAALIPFLPLYYKQLGFPGSHIGLLASLPPAMMVVGSASWGAIADATGAHRRILLGAVAGVAATAVVISQLSGFFALLPAVVVLGILLSPIIPLADRTVLQELGSDAHRYGRVRLWGAVGWGISAPIAGWIVDRFGITATFLLFALLMAVEVAVSAKMRVAQSAIGPRFLSALAKILKDTRWVLFLVVVLSAGIGMGIIHSYLLVYLDDIGAPGIIMGLSLTAATLSELVMFLAAERLIARWGPARLLLFTLALSGVRLLLYSVILAPWGALLVQLLHGPTFSLMYVCGVTTANRLAPEGMEATSQGLFTAVNFGLGGVIGAVLGGLLYDWLTIFGMFRVAGAALILVPVAFAIHAQVHGELPFGASQERE